MERHLPSCHEGNQLPCPAQMSLHNERIGEHWWSGWPGAFCMKCGSSDPMGQCLADSCHCPCHDEVWDRRSEAARKDDDGS